MGVEIDRRSRRDFLQTTATTGAAAYGLTLTRSAHAAGNNSIKIGMIGSIRAGQPVNHQETMIDSTYMAIMGQIACYTGKPVTWKQMMAADFEFEPKVEEATLDMEPPTLPEATGNYPLPVPGLTELL